MTDLLMATQNSPFCLRCFISSFKCIFYVSLVQAVPLNLVEKALYKYIIIIVIIRIKSDFLKHKMVKTNDKI